MHELGMCEGILDTALRRAAGRPVTRVRVRVGVLHRAVGPAMEQAFELVAAGTEAEGAELDMVTLPVRVTCRACGAERDSDELLIACPACGSGELDQAGGDELLLESIELAVGADSERSAHVSRDSG
jgi:hydrogenase nickel incorporation protein HypA/HybF